MANKNPDTEITVPVFSNIATSDTLDDAFKTLQLVQGWTDDYSKKLTSVNPKAVEMARENAYLKFFGAFVTEQVNYGVGVYSQKEANASMYRKGALKIGSDDNLYQLINQSKQNLDPVTDTGGNWLNITNDLVNVSDGYKIESGTKQYRRGDVIDNRKIGESFTQYGGVRYCIRQGSIKNGNCLDGAGNVVCKATFADIYNHVIAIPTLTAPIRYTNDFAKKMYNSAFSVEIISQPTPIVTRINAITRPDDNTGYVVSSAEFKQYCLDGNSLDAGSNANLQVFLPMLYNDSLVEVTAFIRFRYFGSTFQAFVTGLFNLDGRNLANTALPNFSYLNRFLNIRDGGGGGINFSKLVYRASDHTIDVIVNDNTSKETGTFLIENLTFKTYYGGYDE